MKSKDDDIVVGPALMTFLIGSIVVAFVGAVVLLIVLRTLMGARGRPL